MSTFAEALYSLPVERLRSIAARRDIDPRRIKMATDKRQLAQLMSAELGKPPSLSRAVLKCNARELRLLQLILSMEARQRVVWRSVLEAAGGAQLADPLGVVLDGLEQLGLAVRLGDSVFVQENLRHQVPMSLSDHYKVAECLNSYDAPTLRNIAERLGLDGSTKMENIQAISRTLLSSDHNLMETLRLSAGESEVLEYLVQSGGAATAIETASAVLQSTDDFFRYDWQNRWKSGKARNAIDQLLARGILYVVSYAYGFNLYLVVPGDLLRVITGEARAAYWTSPLPQPREVDAPLMVQRQTTLIRDVVVLLGFISTQEAVRTNTGYIHKTSLKHLTRLLSLPDETYAAFLYATSRQAGLIAPLTEKNTYSVTPKGGSWLEMPTLEQIRALYTAWSRGDIWGEMYSEPLKRANEYRAQDAIASVRSAALELVAVCCDDRFFDIGSLTESLSFRYPLLLSAGNQFGGDLVPSPATFMRSLVGQCLYWLGLADLGWSRPAGSLASASPSATARGAASVTQNGREDMPELYRLTPEGAYLLNVPGAEMPDEPPTETQFILQANSEIFLPPYLSARTLFDLLAITEVPGKSAFASIVALTRESIRRALDHGISGKAILEFLRTHTRTGIPQNVEYLINEVGEKHGHIHIGRAQMYLQVDSPIVLKELQARRELKGYFVRSLGDTIAILNATDPDKLLKELRKAGYLPISDDAPTQAGVKFGTRGTPGKPVSALLSKRPAGASEPTDVNWERFAQDDGKPYRESAAQVMPTTRPDDAIQDKGNIRFLLLEAVRNSHRVQVAYKGQAEGAQNIRAIEPHRVMGNFVVAYLPMEAEEVTLNINRILWARSTGEVFAPPD